MKLKHKKFPEDYEERNSDKYHYRYRGGESYHDLVLRLEPIIMELERQRNILIIGHQAVLRCIYAYFLNYTTEELPYIKIPLHTVISLTPKAHGCEEKWYSMGIDAVDTHRDPRQHKTIQSPMQVIVDQPMLYNQRQSIRVQSVDQLIGGEEV
ncbi:Fructose-2,6-bisphosphatase [Coelomomyces lativittatus]|nr:Fructose-2,6-bisphosphatase [Coelomomyces lativittatus]